MWRLEFFEVIGGAAAVAWPHAARAAAGDAGYWIYVRQHDATY